MLSYELAKELRDNGFPQLGDGYALILDKKLPESDETVMQIPWSLYVYKPKEKAIYAPTLSELIEALPKVIDGAYFNIYWFDDVWRAAYTITECEDTFADGKTLEEAVANLWLKLNKK